MSPAVAAAMARLEAMRAARGIAPRPPADAGQLDQAPPVDLVNWSIRNAQKLLQAKRARPGRGWASQDGPGRAESGAAGESIAVPAENATAGQFARDPGRVAGAGDGAGGLSPRAASVRIAPDLVLYAAQCGDFAPARLYLVAAALDPAGRRLLDLDPLAALLTDKRSAWYLYGRRRLATVLRAGEGVYWQREKGPAGRLRLRLRSRARLVAHYGITLTGHEVIMPAALLLAEAKDHGRAREAGALAAVYAAAHAGRRAAGPISRAKIAAAMGLSRWRQRRYERRRGIASRKQIAIDGGFSDHRLASLRHERIAAWRHVDRRGLFGRRGAVYVGRQLPNTYKAGSQYARVKSTRGRRRINAAARHLSLIRDMGRRQPFARVFFDNLRSAGKAASREAGRVDARPVYARQPGRAGARSPVRVGVWVDLVRRDYAAYLQPGLWQEGVI